MSDSVILESNLSQATPTNQAHPINKSNDFHDEMMS